MALDFTGIVKKRVPFVPYVQLEKSDEKSSGTANTTAGQAALLPLSIMSSTSLTGQDGQAWTRITLEDMRRASFCYNKYIVANGQTGHAGHAITPEDVEYFDERAGVSEFEGQLCRADAEAQAFSEWRAWRSGRVYH